jgi:hypothetical protein
MGGAGSKATAVPGGMAAAGIAIDVPPLPSDPVLPDVGALEREMAAMAARTDALMASGDLDDMVAVPAAAAHAAGSAPKKKADADVLGSMDDVEIEEDELEELEAELADLEDEMNTMVRGRIRVLNT